MAQRRVEALVKTLYDSADGDLESDGGSLAPP